jgi:Putative Ig domain
MTPSPMESRVDGWEFNFKEGDMQTQSNKTCQDKTERDKGRRNATSSLLMFIILAASLTGCGSHSSTSTHAAGLAVSTPSLPNGTIGATYQQGLAATGGTPPYSWSTVSSEGALPSGLTLNGAGMISGIPMTVQTSSFMVEVSDSAGSTADGSFSITINNAGLSVNPAQLNFSAAGSQTFAVSGGTGTITENDNCAASGVASVASPASGMLGTWTVTPLANGACSINLSDSSGATASVGVSVAIQSGGVSSLTIQMEESGDCGGETIYYRFFDETDNLVWPDWSTAYYFPYSDQVYTSTLSCQTGATICYGGSFYINSEVPEYWGVGIDNDETAQSNSCYTCENGTTPVNILSCSPTPNVKLRREGNMGTGNGQKFSPPVGRGPRFDPAKDELK